MANEYQPGLQKSRQQSLIHPNKPLDVRAKERGPCFKAAVEHRHNMHDHREGGGNHASCTDKNDITAALVEQETSRSLPPREIPDDFLFLGSSIFFSFKLLCFHIINN